MAVVVNLKDIIDGMDFQGDETTSYLNKRTGEVVTVTDEEFRAAEDGEPMDDFPDWQHEAIRIAGEVLATEDYMALPSKFDIHEYAIMERFCLSIDDERIQETMYGYIKGKGAFRRFKDNINRYGIAEEWYKYRDGTIRQMAIDWCEENGVKFKD